ncbi:MAG: adenylate/guanylate cyclase domain-containing protein [Pseudomonadota bacterium]
MSNSADALDWLHRATLDGLPLTAVLDGLVERLRAGGVPIDRMHLSHPVLHPLVYVIGVDWTPERGAVSATYDHSSWSQPRWLDSPLFAVVRGWDRRLRRRLSGPEAVLDFPMLTELSAVGFTDYVASALPFAGFFRPPRTEAERAVMPTSTGIALSYATRREGGFSDADMAQFDALLAPLGVLVKTVAQSQIAETIARCYIGERAGPRVLGGEITLGDVASTEAVIWVSDLRGSTPLAARLPGRAFTALINAFFDCTLGAVVAEGGEPLTLMGDGAVAIFPLGDEGLDGARAAALRAVTAAEARLARLNTDREAEGEAPLRWGLGLDVGTVDYGNIGIVGRQSWSVLGDAVNRTARLEGLTKSLGRKVLATEAFVAGLTPPWEPLGRHPLAGLAAPVAVFAPLSPTGAAP